MCSGTGSKMNLRILELAEQTGWDSHHSKFDTRIEKFAELLIQECIYALWTEECRTNAMSHADYERSGNRIHKHFWG